MGAHRIGSARTLGNSSKSSLVLRLVVTAALLVLAATACGSQTDTNENVAKLQQATTGSPSDPAGVPGAGCAHYVEQLPDGRVKYAVTFPEPQAYVEVFVRQNGIQNIAQNIVSSAVANGDGTYTYSLVKPASQYQAGVSPSADTCPGERGGSCYGFTTL